MSASFGPSTFTRLAGSQVYTQDYELDLAGVYDGATKLIERTHTRTDNLNLTNIGDNVSVSNNQSFWANPANRLQNADGPWGSRTFFYDGVGNRTFENSTVGSTTTSDQCTYASTSNRIQSIIRGTTTLRSFGYDGAGNPGLRRGRRTSDSRALFAPSGRLAERESEGARGAACRSPTPTTTPTG